MTTQQPEALRLAEKLHEGICSLTVVMQPAAAMLRAQHARIAELESQLAATQDYADRISDMHAAPQAVPDERAAQGMEARNEAFEAVRKVFCKLQRYSFLLDGSGNVRRCADHCGNWVEFESVHTLFEPQSVDAALAAQAKQEEK